MSNTTKALIAFAVVAGAFGLAAFFGYSPFLKVIQNTFGASPAGTSFTTAKIAEQSVPVSTSTIFSYLNSDANDRTITGAVVGLTNGGTTTANLIQCATSSVATGFSSATPNFILNATIDAAGLTYGTSSASNWAYIASTSPGITGTSTPQSVPVVGGLFASSTKNFARNWASGTYLVCELANTSNATVFPSTETGFVGFNYIGQ